MVKVKEDLTGKIFGKLMVLRQAEDYIDPKGVHRAQWLCQCSCPDSKQVVVVGAKLKSGHSTSCGCARKECAIALFKKTNKYSKKQTDEYGDYYVGWTSNTNKEFYIDASDFELVCKYCWREHISAKTGYRCLVTYNPETKKQIKMHQLVCGKYYDHIDRNPLNNRKHNLRPATAQENIRNRNLSRNNTSGFIGVTWGKTSSKWVSNIQVDGKNISLGSFADKTDAIRVRLAAELKYFGEFAPQRHLFEEYEIE